MSYQFSTIKCVLHKLTLLLWFISPQVHAEILSFGLDLSEGGRLTPKAVGQFEMYMAQQDCELKIVAANKPDTTQLYFSPLERITAPLHQQKLLSISTLNNEPLTITILVKSSTGINDLSSLKNQRVAIISHSSYVGGVMAKNILSQSIGDLEDEKVYETRDYFGALSLLLHGDVFTAAIPGPLARQWKDHNKLSIIAESQGFSTGGLFIASDIEKSKKTLCMTAFSSLKRKSRRDRKMNIFPSWAVGFKATRNL